MFSIVYIWRDRWWRLFAELENVEGKLPDWDFGPAVDKIFSWFADEETAKLAIGKTDACVELLGSRLRRLLLWPAKLVVFVRDGIGGKLGYGRFNIGGRDGGTSHSSFDGRSIFSIFALTRVSLPNCFFLTNNFLRHDNNIRITSVCYTLGTQRLVLVLNGSLSNHNWITMKNILSIYHEI